MLEKKYYPGLDLLRFVLSIVILFYHYAIFFGAKPGTGYLPLSLVYGYGKYCVEVFFMVSGCLIYWSKAKSIQGGVSLYSFLCGRIIRLYPLMLLTTTVAAVGLWLTAVLYPEGHLFTNGWLDRNTVSLVGAVLNLLNVQTGWMFNHTDAFPPNAPAWYLSILMICYAIFFLVIRAAKKNRTVENCAFIFLSLFGAYIGYVQSYPFPLLYRSCGRGYTSFFLGTLLAQIIARLDTAQKRRRAALTAAGMLLLFAFCFHTRTLGSFELAFCFVLAPALVLFVTTSRLVTFISNNAFVRYLGAISFGIFMWDQPLALWTYFLQDVFHLQIEWANKFTLLANIMAVILAAVLTHEIFDKPIAKRLKALQKASLEK